MTTFASKLGAAAMTLLLAIPVALAQEPKDAPRAQPDLERVLHGLEQGIEALRALGKEDAREMLEAIANDVRKERATRRAQQEHPELAAARDQLEVFRIALDGLAAGKRHDAAEAMERAIRAAELRLEGKRGADAQEVFAKAPDHAQTTELLAFAAQNLREQGKPDRAERVGRLAEKFGERYRERGRDDAQARLDALQKQVEELWRQIEELRKVSPSPRRETPR